MIANIPETDLKRIVIIGAGFAGLKLAQKLLKSKYQVVLIDKENYHSFQPLMYQVATAGLEPSSIAFPLPNNATRSDSSNLPKKSLAPFLRETFANKLLLVS